MASADRNHLIAACCAAVDNGEKLTPNARLWLARASLRSDPKGRTRYGASAYSFDTGDTINNGNDAIDQLLALGLLAHDHDDEGAECWRLMHYAWDAKPQTIGGYGPDRGLKRDGNPPGYGRPVDHVIGPNTGNLDFEAPKWADIAESIRAGRQPEPDPEW